MTGKREFLVGKRVTVIGLGIEGVDVARYAASHGASVTVTDAKPREALTERIAELGDLPIDLFLGGTSADHIRKGDLVFVSQGVPLEIPPIPEARERGAEITSMTRYFMEHCPGPIIGITGSSGKTTTTSLVAAMIAAADLPYRVGGNIGTGLLGLLDGIDERTWTVMEVSHTQLALTDRSPHVAAILNVTPNHLDRFSWEDYVALKQNLVRHQSPDDYVVLNLDNPVSAAATELTPARASHFSLGDSVPGDGAFIRDDAVWLSAGGVDTMVLPVTAIPLRGEHNVANVTAAVAIAALAGVQPETMADAIRAFRAVPHRLEFVAEVNGVSYVNDSIASTPERTLAGLRAFPEPLVLLLGGKDKDLPKDELAEEALRRCHGIVFFGADGPLMEAAVEANAALVPYEDRPTTALVTTLAEAVHAAREIAAPGEVVLLSPACTSFDAYNNFEERGEEFRRIVGDIAQGRG